MLNLMFRSSSDEEPYVNIMPHNPVKVIRRFGGICRFHVRTEELAMQETRMKRACSRAVFFISFFSVIEDAPKIPRRRHFLMKLFDLIRLFGLAVFIVPL